LRIELGEIERALLSHPAVAQAVVVLRDSPGGPELVGYYRGEAPVAELRDQLAGWLPAYMIPARLVPVTDFALNASGKIDKRALPDPEPERAGDRLQVAPAGRTEA